MPRTAPLTSAQVKAHLRSQGVTITQWALARGYSRRDVYRVLNGQLKAHFGRAHEIAVALGMKAPSQEPSTAGASRNPQSVAAA
jgi:gp16 family phage-associated protein